MTLGIIIGTPLVFVLKWIKSKLTERITMEQHLVDRGPTLGTLQLNRDYYAGLREATDNGQMRIALEYATRTIADLWDELNELRGTVQDLLADVQEFKAAKAPFRKVSKGNNPEPAKDPKPDEPEPE